MKDLLILAAALITFLGGCSMNSAAVSRSSAPVAGTEFLAVMMQNAAPAAALPKQSVAAQVTRHLTTTPEPCPE